MDEMEAGAVAVPGPGGGRGKDEVVIPPSEATELPLETEANAEEVALHPLPDSALEFRDREPSMRGLQEEQQAVERSRGATRTVPEDAKPGRPSRRSLVRISDVHDPGSLSPATRSISICSSPRGSHT